MSKKKIITIILAVVLIAIAGVSVYIIMTGGKDNKSNSEVTTTTTTAASQKNLSSVITSTAGLSKFNQLLVAAGLEDSLKGTTLKYIVMAPRNGAFNALPVGYYDSLLTADKVTAAQNIAQYHIATVTTEQLTNGQKLRTLTGQEVIVGIAGSKYTFTSAKGDKATATSTQKTSNGTLYIIDTVLLPQ